MKFLPFLAFLSLAVVSARAQSGAPVVRPGELPPVDHMVYLSFLPEPSELTKDAAANGLEILRLDHTADQVIVSYKYPDGHTATLGYAKLSSKTQPVRVERRVVTTPEPEVVYYERRYEPRYVYSDPVDNFWLPLTLGVGLGWATTWHGGHGHYYHGGYYGRGGWRR